MNKVIRVGKAFQIVFLFALALLQPSFSFVPINNRKSNGYVSCLQRKSLESMKAAPYYIPIALQKQRKSVARVQTMGLFGLGVPEIIIIIVAFGVLIGPQGVANIGRDVGKMTSELKTEVPKEFQKGVEEGEINARSKKARKIKVERVE